MESVTLDLLEQMTGYVILKDKNSIYIGGSTAAANLLGFNKASKFTGITDFELPCRAAEFAEGFREQDRYVISQQKTLKILDIHPYAHDEWKVMLCVKKPFYDKKQHLVGALCQSIDFAMPNILQLGSVLCKSFVKNKKQQKFQHSYAIDNGNFSEELTNREKECLFFLIRGKSAKEIAKIFNISPRTVECYLESIKIKLNCNARNELIDKVINSSFAYTIPENLFNTQLSILLED